MSKLSLYQTSWINLIFQDKNKEYGAYQLCQESAKTSLTALFMGLLFSVAVVAVPLIISYFNPQNGLVITISEFTNTTVQLTNILQSQLVETPTQVLSEIQKQTTAIPILNDQLAHPVIVQAPLASPNILKTTDYTSATITPTKGMATATTSTSFSSVQMN